MASYHFAMQIIGRSAGRSAIAAAAYRSGQKLIDERTQTTHDYSHRRGVVHQEIMAPEGSAAWLKDRQRLWSHVEELEKRKDAQLAREINIALPSELEADDRLALLRDFVQSQFVARGMVADIAIHEPVEDRFDDPRNHHAHIMLTLRGATPSGLYKVKTREWNSDSMLSEWREAWANHQNRWLEYRGWDARVDHRSLKAQRAAAQERGDRVQAAILHRVPEIHVGPKARAAIQNERTLTSKDRLVRSRANRPRVRQYPQHDNGTRVHHLIRRLEKNLDRFDRTLTRWRQRVVRLQTRHRFLSREEFEAQQERERWERQRSWLRQREREEAIAAAIRRVSHARAQKKKAEALVAGIENVLRGLVGIKDRQVKRRGTIRDRKWSHAPVQTR
ncbi:MobQ family relaxase, partial [Jiella mangrovi]